MENQVPQTPTSGVPLKPSKFLLVPVLLVTLVILLGTIVYLAYQNQQLKQMLAEYKVQNTPQPIVSPQPTAEAKTSDWKTYTNTKYNYSFKYPSNYIIDKIGSNSPTNLDVINICPKSTSSHCFEPDSIGFVVKSESFKLQLEEKMTVVVGDVESIKNYSGYWGGDWVNVYIPANSSYISIGTDRMNEKLFDQILFTFKFLDNKEQVACTMEAKICPDGSSVGRTGPNCEFAPCPTP